MGLKDRNTRRAMVVSLAFVAAGLLALTVWLAASAPVSGAALAAITAVLIAAGIALWHVCDLSRRHFKALDRLRGAVVTLAGNRGAVLPVRVAGEGGTEIGRLHDAIADLAARHARDAAAPDARLAAVLGSITEAMVVITEQGQVSLVNYPTKVLLDAERVCVGTSVFAALKRKSVVAAVDEARRAGHPVVASLHSVAGAE